MRTRLRALGLAAALGLHAAGTALAQRAEEPSHLYTTQRSDTVIGIGRRLLTEPNDWPAVAEFNGLKNPNRIRPGTGLRIPLRLLRSEAASARLEQVVGDVRAGSGAAAVTVRNGEALTEGTQVQTGAEGYAVLRLADGSVLRLARASTLQIERARRYPVIDHVSSGVRLDSGRVEVDAAKAAGGKPGFEVRSPQGVLAVRGTSFRVTVVEGKQLTGGEVLEGAVQFAGDANARELAAGFGTLIDAQRRVTEPTPLLGAPSVAAMPALQERLVLRFPLAAMAGAAGHRGQVGRTAQMNEVVADNLTTGAELRFTDLDDGDYVLKIRAIDARGLEGRDALLPFKLKARPEPPMPSAPAPRAVTRGTEVELAWASNPEARAYRLQLASDERFTRVLRDLPALADARFVLDKLPPGDYYWRLASVRGADDQGPWGAVRSFVLRPPMATPAPPAVGNTSMKFTWEGEPGQTFEFQLAHNAQFAPLVLAQQSDKPELELRRPPGGVYFMRLRARDADGFQGPYTTPQRFEIIDCIQVSEGPCVRAGSGEPLRRP